MREKNYKNKEKRLTKNCDMSKNQKTYSGNDCTKTVKWKRRVASYVKGQEING